MEIGEAVGPEMERLNLVKAENLKGCFSQLVVMNNHLILNPEKNW